jgi:hypothetical protein
LGFSPVTQTDQPPGDWTPTYEVPISLEDGFFDTQAAFPQSTSPKTINPVAEQNHITVAFSGTAENYPRVSSCGDGLGLYLVIYEESYDIRGRKIDRNGSTVGDEFTIFDGSGSTDFYFDADVSCEVFRNRFIVVAAHQATTYHTIDAIAVKGTSSPGSELVGSSITLITSLSTSYKQPAIACDGDARACLVVFVVENASDDVYAQRLADISPSPYLTLLGDLFILGNDTIDENLPDVAWGGNHDSYLVVWQFYHNTLTHYQLVFSHVKELEVGPGSVETYHGPILLFGNHTNHQLSARIAYNRYDTNYPYWVVFTYDGQGDLSDFDIYAQGVGGSTGTVVNYNNGRTIAAYGLEPYDEAWADIAFAAGTENYDQPHPDQFLVTFLCGSNAGGNAGLCGRTLQSVSPYAVVEEWWEYFQIDNSDSRIIGFTSGIGTIYHNRYLVTWDEQYSEGSEDYDIFASLIAPFGTFVPLIIK